MRLPARGDPGRQSQPPPPGPDLGRSPGQPRRGGLLGGGWGPGLLILPGAEAGAVWRSFPPVGGGRVRLATAHPQVLASPERCLGRRRPRVGSESFCAVWGRLGGGVGAQLCSRLLRQPPLPRLFSLPPALSGMRRSAGVRAEWDARQVERVEESRPQGLVQCGAARVGFG